MLVVADEGQPTRLTLRLSDDAQQSNHTGERRPLVCCTSGQFARQCLAQHIVLQGKPLDRCVPAPGDMRCYME